MSSPLRFEFLFEASYEVGEVSRPGSEGRAFSFPDAVPLGRHESFDRPTVRVTPQLGDSWFAVFYGGEFRFPSAASGRLIAWPDGSSFCVVFEGAGVVVRADDPTQTYEVDCFPVTDTIVVRERRLVVFADFTNLVAYGAEGVVWRSRRLALDDLRIEGVEGDALRVAGFFGGSSDRFLVNLQTGEASGQPFQPPE
jgi:hypothetical protein